MDGRLDEETIGVDVSTDTTLQWLRQAGSIRPNVNVTWSNFWTSSVSVSRNLPQRSVSPTRVGPLMARAPGWSASTTVVGRSFTRRPKPGPATR